MNRPLAKVAAVFAALPPDVRKGSAFPLAIVHLSEAAPRTGGVAAKGKGRGTEGHSPSAHRAAEPRKQSDFRKRSNEKFAIKIAVWKIVLYLLGCLLFVIAGVFLTFEFKGLILSIVGIVTIGFFGFGFFVLLFRGLLDRRPLIVIDEKGIYDRRLGVGRIDWEDIESVKLNSGSTNSSIFLKLVSSEKSSKILSNVSNKILNFLNGDLELGILNLNLTLTDTKPHKVFETILNHIPEKQINRFRQNL